MTSTSWWHRSANMVAKELVPVVRAVRIWGKQWTNQIVLVCLDNEGAVLAWNAGRSSNALTQHILQQLHIAVEEAGVYLIAMHLHREINLLSDALSHFNRCWIGRAFWGKRGLRLASPA